MVHPKQIRPPNAEEQSSLLSPCAVVKHEMRDIDDPNVVHQFNGSPKRGPIFQVSPDEVFLAGRVCEEGE